MSDDPRPDPDALLAQIQDDAEAPRSRGRLKIFFGAAPGVGKTYAMLEAGRRAAADGMDVLIGYVEPHVRPDTYALVLGLDFLPRRKVEYRGATLQEFDLEGAIARKPRLLLVDELAHTNAPGSTHAKRWQDVKRLMEEGIDVWTTLNVQHLESLNDVVARITGVVVRETVPDAIFDEAHEVELIDLPPDDLVERLREGKVYVPGQAERAVENFFRKGNLIALRELALRRTAERVGMQVRDYRRAHAIRSTWQTTERLLVCVGPSPGSAPLVRAARRIASRLHAPWTAVHVETPGSASMPRAARDRLMRNLQLAESLGAQVVTLGGVSLVDEVLDYARAQNITRIVVGKPREPRWKEWIRGSFVYDLTRKCGEIDVYVISGEPDRDAGESAEAPVARPFRARPYVEALAAVAACTALAWPFAGRLEPVNLAMIYLVGVLAVALRSGLGPSTLAAVLGVLAFDFCFVPPRFTMAVSDTEYLITFAVMLLTGLVISTLTTRVRLQAELARRRERRTASLYALSRELTALRRAEDASVAIAREAGAALDADVILGLPDPAEGLAIFPEPPPFRPEVRDRSVARWVLDNNRPAGLGTQTLPGAEALYLPLDDAGQVLGVLGVKPHDPARAADPEYRLLIDAFAGQAAVALARIRYVHQAEQVQLDVERERLRSTLLSAVSHDLRTPLAAVAGASSTLLEGSDTLPVETRRELLRSILDSAEGLNRTVGNLLEVTRLESGSIVPRKDWQSLEELFGVVYGRLRTPLDGHPITTSLPHDLPLILADGPMIEEVLQNLLENAARFSPPGSPIEVSAVRSDGELTVEVADRGPGLPPGDPSRLFERFRRGDVLGTPVRGAGLGLAICRGILDLHDGRIVAADRPGGGALFRFTIPLDETPPAPEPEPEPESPPRS